MKKDKKKKKGVRVKPDPRQASPALNSIRESIDDIDRRIHELLNERAKFAQEVGNSKRSAGLGTADFYKPEREAQVLRKALERNKGPLRNEEIERAKQPGYVSRYDDFDFEYTDGTRPRPARFDQPHPYPADPRVRVFRQAQHGISPARNHALKMAKGAFITVLDSDDELASDALRLLHDFLIATSSPWVYADYHEMGQEVSRLIRLPEYRSAQSMLRGILTRPRLPFKHSGMTIQRDLLLSMGGYDESLRLFAEKVLPAVQAMPTPINPASLGQPNS